MVFYEKIEDEGLAVNEKEKHQIQEQLRNIDEKRLVLFASIASAAIIVIIALDFFFFDETYFAFYLAFDSVLFVVSLLLIIFFYLEKKSSTRGTRFLKKAIFEFYPAFTFLWATAICATDPTSILNIITFYFILFIYIFGVITPFKTLILYYLFISAEFIFISITFDKPILTDNTIAMLLVCTFVLPFYTSFRKTRERAQASLILLNKAKSQLETEVDTRTRELLLSNSNLEEEIAQRKIIESKLREALKTAESNNRLKSEFLANISHEIRTPMNSIAGFTEMLIDENISHERKKEFQKIVQANARSLLSTIEDIFDASLIQTEQLKPEIRPFAVNPFLLDFVHEANNIAQKYGKSTIILAINPSPIDDLTIFTDSLLLKKILIRLTDNAFKFTEEGTINIGVSLEKNSVNFFVSDTGIGIPDKDSIRIFDPFVQGNGSFTRDYGGSGLGLSVVKGITRALGASISFTSQVGAGARFVVSFSSSIIQN